MALTAAERIARALIEDIDSGATPPGSKLPPVAELATVHEVGLSTMRRALERLEGRGHVTPRSGVGWFVAESPPPPTAPVESMVIEHEQRLKNHERRIRRLERGGSARTCRCGGGVPGRGV